MGQVITFGERLKELRKSKHLTQAQLGEMVGVIDRTIQRYESGKIQPTMEVINKLARALDTTTSYLLGEETNFTKENQEAKFVEFGKAISVMMAGGEISEESQAKIVNLINRAYYKDK